MNEHTIFYYPYASFSSTQLPLLKAAALYFDKLYILDPEKAVGGAVLPGAAREVALLEGEKILERVSPEEVLHHHEDAISAAIREDLNDPEFMQLCATANRPQVWTLALAKVPRAIRDDPAHQEYRRRRPQDQAMRRLLGELPRDIAGNELRYIEAYAEVAHHIRNEEFVYDETRLSENEIVEYRYADYPLPLGESIMVNHALYAGMAHVSATPLTDDPFHNQVLALKLRRARQLPGIKEIVAARATRQNLLAAGVLTDTQLSLPMLSDQLPLDELLEYRRRHSDQLAQARERLGWLARRITEEPWTETFEATLEHEVIPNIADELGEAKKARDAWLASRRGKLALSAAGIGLGAATTVLTVVVAPITPVALALAGLGLATGTVIPGAEWLLDWREGRRSVQENGLHYLLTSG